MKRLLIVLLVCSLAASLLGEESKTWLQFVEAKENGAEPILPDFSYAGYHGGADAIPNVRGPIFNVARYGAKGDGPGRRSTRDPEGDRRRRSRGGGVVFFPPGTFRVNADMAHRRPIRVRQGHVVLRGSGAARGGTIILVDEPTLKIPKPAKADAPAASEASVAEPAPGSDVPDRTGKARQRAAARPRRH